MRSQTARPSLDVATKQRLKQQMDQDVQRVEHALDGYLPKVTLEPSQLYKAMRYAVLGGGKRIRALLVYASGELLGVSESFLDAAASAIELIHAYSLVHDDLPAMDDDDLRRGKPSLHKAYDEATAILAGDALQTLAFDILATVAYPEQLAAERQRGFAIACLAHAAGASGMVAGQALDMQGEQQQFDQQQIETMFRLKTGALLQAAITLPLWGDNIIDQRACQQLNCFAKAIGLAFQIRDDILDVEADTATLGKPQGSDAERDKSSYPAILGMDYAKQRADALYHEAMNALDPFGEQADRLRFIADFIIRREY